MEAAAAKPCAAFGGGRAGHGCAAPALGCPALLTAPHLIGLLSLEFLGGVVAVVWIFFNPQTVLVKHVPCLLAFLLLHTSACRSLLQHRAG